MKPSDIEQALLDGLLQGVKDHVGKIVDIIIADGADTRMAEQVTRFSNGLRMTRAFYAAGIAEIKKEFGEV